MNQAAKDLIAREARRARAHDLQSHRQAYQRTMVNPITVEEHMLNFEGDPDGAFEVFAHAYPDVADFDGADRYFAACYCRSS